MLFLQLLMFGIFLFGALDLPVRIIQIVKRIIDEEGFFEPSFFSSEIKELRIVNNRATDKLVIEANVPLLNIIPRWYRLSAFIGYHYSFTEFEPDEMDKALERIEKLEEDFKKQHLASSVEYRVRIK